MDRRITDRRVKDRRRGKRSLKHNLRKLFYGRTESSTLLGDLLLMANLFIITIAILGLFLDLGPIFVAIEFAFGVAFLIEYLLRFWVSRHKTAYVFRMVNVLDVLVIGSLLMTPVAPSLAFLRILRVLQLLRAYKFMGRRFDHHNDFIHRNYEIITSLVNILVFLVVMSGVVFLQQSPINENMNNFVDALYFTIAAVTTTGFGDIVVLGTSGKLISIFIMIFGVTLFFRLIKSIFVPRQLYVVCDGCGHDSHPLDAHFCGRCGTKLKHHRHLEHFHLHKDDF